MVSKSAGRKVRRKPKDIAPPPWPEAESEDTIAEVARRLVLNFNAARGSRSIRAIAKLADVPHSSLVVFLRGERWPDTETLAKLERALGEPIWPGPITRRDA